MKRLAMLSMHSSPLASLGGRETGGMNVYVREVCRELGRRGWFVDILTRRQDDATPRIQPLSDRVRVVNLAAGPQRPCSKSQLPRYIGAFAHQVRQFADEEGVSYDLLHGHYWLSGMVALELRKCWPIPFVQMFHTLAALKNHVASATGEWEPQERIHGERQVMAEADVIVASTHAEKAQVAWFYGTTPERVRVIPCGVDLARFNRAAWRSRSPVQLPGKRNILYVGRLERIKGLEVLLRAAAELAPQQAADELPHIVLIGGERAGQEGNGKSPKSQSPQAEEVRLRKLAASLGIASRVNFLGPQAQELLPAYYAAADVVVLPSYYESFGLVALEAMACGTPVIASKVGGLPYAVEEAASGYLIPPGSVSHLADRLAKLLGDERLRRCFGLRGAMAVRKFAWPRIVQQVQATYDELVEGRTTASSLEWTAP